MNNPIKKGHHFSRQQIEYQILTATPKALHEMYSNRLRIVIQRLLEKDMNRRISAGELLNLIPKVEVEEEPTSILPSVREPLLSPKRVTFDKHGNKQSRLSLAKPELQLVSNKQSELQSENTPKSILKRPSEANLKLAQINSA